MNAFSQWRAACRLRDEVAVLEAIRMLRPSQASGVPISRLSGVRGVHPVLVRLERSGRVVSEWTAGPYPRRRLYRLVTQAAQR